MTTTDNTQKTRAASLNQRSEEVLAMVKASDGGPSLERELNVIGSSALKRATEARKMMQPAVDRALPELEKDSPLAAIINEATLKTAELNPNTVSNSFLFKYIPIPMVKKWMMKKYISNFKSESSKIDEIFSQLEHAKEALLEKMIELEEQYKTLKQTRTELQEEINLCTIVQDQLDTIDTSGMDEFDQRKYENAQNKVARRLRDLETIQAAINQFFISIDQTFDVQRQLNQAIDSIRTVGPIVLQNAVMIHSAINQQKAVSEAVQNTSKSIGDAMKQNAEMVKGNAQRVADIYNNPVIALDDLKTAYADLEEAIRITNEARNSSTQKAREMTTQLQEFNRSVEPVVENLNEEVRTRNEQGDEVSARDYDDVIDGEVVQSDKPE